MHIRHLPVIEGTKIVGLISIGDLVRSIIAYQELMIYQLEKYICGDVSISRPRREMMSATT